MNERRPRCDFCDQPAKLLFMGRLGTARICVACVEGFHQEIADGDLPTLTIDGPPDSG